MKQNFSFSELYDVKLKTTHPIEVNNKTYESGEIITTFDRIQIANLDEVKSYISAHGGFNDRDRVIWEDVKQINFTFSQGIFSKLQLAMLSNSRMLENDNSEKLYISKREYLEIDENGKVMLQQIPFRNIFVYNFENGERIKDFHINNKTIFFNNIKFLDIIVDYEYEYEDKNTKLILGQRLLKGFLSMEGKTKIKEDITGEVKTGIIKIPKLKIISNLSITLGQNANPVIANFYAIGFPIGERSSTKIMEMIILDEDIDSELD